MPIPATSFPKILLSSEDWLDLQRRRGATLLPWPNLTIGHADCATVIGNRVTLDTFQYAGKPLYALRVPSAVTFDWNGHKNFELPKLPQLHLHICGPITNEADFTKVYERELFQMPNIHLHGWVSVRVHRVPVVLRRSGRICCNGRAGRFDSDHQYSDRH